MIQKLALAVGGLGAAAVLAFALGLTNFVFAGPGTAPATADTQLTAQTVDNVAASSSQDQGVQAQTKKVIDKVYIAPAASPKVIKVAPPAQANKPAQAAPPKAPAAAPSRHDDGGYDDGHEGQESEHSDGRGHERGDD